MIKGFAALAPQYTPTVFFSKRYPEVIIRASYPLDPPDEVVATIGDKLDSMHSFYLGSCSGAIKAISNILKRKDPYGRKAALDAIANVIAEHEAGMIQFAKAIRLPEQLSIFSRYDEAQGLDEELYHAEVERATATETQANAK